MKRIQITRDVGIFILLFGLALFVRMLNLADSPLSDYEAGWALPSWAAVTGEEVHIGPNPGYFALTTSLFYLFGSSNALARFWPAIAGSLVVWLPFGFRRLLTREAAVIMALGLALDPGMVAVSRIAGGPMMALGFSVVSLVFLFRQRPIWMGIFAGLALTSGPSIFLGITGFLIAYWIVRSFGLYPEMPHSIDGSSDEQDTKQPIIISIASLRLIVISAAATFLIVSTLFGRYPDGLGAWGSSLATFFRGWIENPSVPIFQPVLAVVFYQPFALVFALVMAGRGWIGGMKRERWLSLWLLVSLSLTVIYSQRAVYDAIWALLPLWMLASIQLAQFIKLPTLPVAAFGQAGLLFVLGVIFWLVSSGTGMGQLTWLVLLVVPILAFLTTILIGLGWSWDSAKTGAVWGISLLLGMYTLSAAFGASQQRQNAPGELWYPTPGTAQAGLFRETLGELALVESGRKDQIQTVSLIDSPSLKWLLRDIHSVRYVSVLEPSTLAAVILTPEDGSDLSQTMSYRGQDFLWYNKPGWTGPLPRPLWSWVTTRFAPTHSESLVMWARSDLFPAEPETAGEEAETEPAQVDMEVEDGSPE